MHLRRCGWRGHLRRMNGAAPRTEFGRSARKAHYLRIFRAVKPAARSRHRAARTRRRSRRGAQSAGPLGETAHMKRAGHHAHCDQDVLAGE